MSATRGVLYVHTAPSALCPHIEWAAAGVFGVPTNFEWTPQPVAPGSYRTEWSWQGKASAASDTAAKLASALRGWNRLRFEITVEPAGGVEGTRYSCTPELGIFATTIDAHGNVLVGENRLKAAILKAALGQVDLADEIDLAMGGPWDAELEPFRQAGDGAPVRWLHKVV